MSGSWEFTDEIDTAPGLPSKYQRHCELSSNPQYTLHIEALCHVTITFTQLDVELQPAACYIISSDGESGDESAGKLGRRISRLSKDVIMASTGQPRSQRVQRIHCSLKSGEYVIMAATLMAGMEGSFNIDVTTDIDVSLEKLWPPADPNELQSAFDSSTLVGRIANRAQAGIQSAANKAGDAINRKLDNLSPTKEGAGKMRNDDDDDDDDDGDHGQ